MSPSSSSSAAQRNLAAPLSPTWLPDDAAAADEAATIGVAVIIAAARATSART